MLKDNGFLKCSSTSDQKNETSHGLIQYSEHLERIINRLLSISDDIITMSKNGVDIINYRQDYETIKEFEELIRDSKESLGHDK